MYCHRHVILALKTGWEDEEVAMKGNKVSPWSISSLSCAIRNAQESFFEHENGSFWKVRHKRSLRLCRGWSASSSWTPPNSHSTELIYQAGNADRHWILSPPAWCTMSLSLNSCYRYLYAAYLIPVKFLWNILSSWKWK